jgi:hypothetical protein
MTFAWRVDWGVSGMVYSGPVKQRFGKPAVSTNGGLISARHFVK